MSGDHQSVVDYVGKQVQAASALWRYLRDKSNKRTQASPSGWQKSCHGWRWHQ